MISTPGTMRAISADVGNQAKLWLHEGEITITVAYTTDHVTWVGRHGIEQMWREEHDVIMDSAGAVTLAPC